MITAILTHLAAFAAGVILQPVIAALVKKLTG